MGTGDALSRASRHLAWIGLAVFALALRVPLLPRHRLVEGDGVHYAHLARSILAGDLSGLSNPYWSNLWPAVLAATSWMTGLDVVTAGRVASLASGVVLVLLVGALAARLLGPTAGLAAGILSAAHPWLIHFSTLVFTESFFACLLVGFLLAALGAAASFRAAARAGLLGGMALATRPEALAAILAAALWLAAAEAPGRGRATLRRAALLLAIVALFVVGRAFLVHRYYALWDFGIGTKGTANLFVGLAETDREKERVSTEVRTDGENVLAVTAEEQSLLRFAFEHPLLLLRHAGRNLVRMAACATRVFPLVPLVGGRDALWDGGWAPLLAALTIATSGAALLGVFWAATDPATRRGTSLLLATGLLYVLGLAPLNVHDRLVVPLVPLFLVFLAHGLVRCARAVGRNERTLRWSLAFVLAVAGALSLTRLLQASTLDYAGDPVVQRETGEWLAAHYPQDTRIMTAAVSVGFYFYEAEHAEQEVALPWAGAGRVLDLARAQGVKLLVIPEWHLTAVQHPAADVLLHPAAPYPGLRLVATLGNEEKGRMLVYEIVSPPGGGRSAP
jgi:hypothetical protein